MYFNITQKGDGNVFNTMQTWSELVVKVEGGKEKLLNGGDGEGGDGSG